ncbi:uncharacterized protein [Ptychodera flava]|uniref:uncharacterized protein n=1 Tax=Ptychodera flava TaxID=63121 RepID=UPI00396A80B9
MQRVHSLLYKNEDEDLSKINCKNYETLKAEPLHDIKGHAKIILDELPHLVSKVERDELEKFIQAALGNADEVRGSDIRKAVILVTKYIEDKQVRGKVSEDISTLMKTLAEISHISYLHDVYRCPKRVLRLYNITFLHGLLCIKLITKPKTMTQRKFYGRYYHNVVVHLPEQYRIISLYSSNTESQERVFNAIRRITKSTSSKRPGEIIGNVFIRLHAEEEARLPSLTLDSEISKLGKSLSFGGNTVFPLNLMRRHTLIQAHMERISDYIIRGADIWWTQRDDGVEFFDGTNEQDSKPEGPILKHFRSSTLSDVMTSVKLTWNEITDKVKKGQITIPLRRVRIYSNDRLVETLDLTHVHGDCHEEHDELPVSTDDASEESYRTINSDNEPHVIMTEITTEDTIGPIDDDGDDGDDGTCDDDLSPPGTSTAHSTLNARTADATHLSSVLPENKNARNSEQNK